MNKIISFLILIGVVFISWCIFYYAKRNRIQDLVYRKNLWLFRQEVLSHLIPGTEKNRIELLFDEAQIKIQSGKFDKNQWEQFNTDLSKSLVDRKLDSLEKVTMIRKLKIFVGKTEK